jgi:hypothetical protein
MIAALSVLIGTLALIAASPSLRTIHAWWTDPTRRFYQHLWFVEHHLARPPVPRAATGSTAPSGTEPTPALAAQAGAGPHVKVTAGRLTGPVPSVTLTGDSSAVADGVEPPPPALESRTSSAGPTTPAPGRAHGVSRPGVGHHDEAGHELPHRHARTPDPGSREPRPTTGAGRHAGDRDPATRTDGRRTDRPDRLPTQPCRRDGALERRRADQVTVPTPQPPVAAGPPDPAATGPHTPPWSAA